MPSIPPPTSFPPPAPSSGEPERVSRVLRFGAVVGAGVIAAAIATVPAASRVSAALPAEATMSAWLALVACAIVPVTIGVAVLRGAREGLRAFSGPAAATHAFGALFWAIGTFAFMAIAGALLRATTHHHALAGVTFALVSLAAALVFALVVRRGVLIAERATPRVRAVLLGLALACAGLALIVAGVGLARAAPASSPVPAPTGALFIDLLAYAISIGFLSRAEFARRHLLAWLGLPVAVGMITLGISFLTRTAGLPDAIADHAPAYAKVMRLFLGR